jgi:hypothetical protein
LGRDDLIGVDIVLHHVNRTCKLSFHKEPNSALLGFNLQTESPRFTCHENIRNLPALRGGGVFE